MLSPEQMLKALRNINTLLSVRLNLHEKIPSHLRNFSISSGRATFQFPDEFEVELSIADEDPSSQLYFIDFRFIFSPAPAEIPAGRLRDQIEGKTNDVLKRENLQGCFEFLHDLTLTHKISILRNQAFEMLRGLWSEDLKVEAVHRSLVIQYWLNRPGGKNWIEIGIKRRKEKTTVSSSETQNIPHVAIRWFRGGKEITNVSINLELGDVSLQRILNKVIAMHTNSIFNEVATRLKETRIYSERLLKLKGFLSPTEPLDAFLFVQLTTSKAVKIIQEPVTGRFALLPASPLFARAEREINSLLNPAVEIHIRVANLRSLVFQEEIEGFARVLGWQELKSVIPGQETIRRLFPRDIQRVGFFGRNKWGSSWLLAFTTSLMGDSWWTVKLEEERAGPDAGNFNGGSSLGVGSLFKAAYRLPMVGTKSLITEPSCLTLSQIESTAVGMISKYTDALYLKKQKLQHRFGSLSPNSLGAESAILYIRFDDDHGQGVSSPSSPESLSWASEIVSLAFNGLDLATYSVFHTALAQLKTPIKGIKKLTSTIGDSVVFHPTSGEFAFHIVTSVGESTIPPLLDRLSSIQRLIYFLSVIRYYKLPCDSVSLSHVEFVYPALSSTLKAILYFPPGDSMRLSFDQGNPHLRIQDYLTSLLRSGDGLKAVLKLLRITLPLLRAFSALEASHLSNRVRILPRSVGWYSMQYENPSGKFDIKLRQRRDELFWFMKDSHLREGGEMNQQVIGLKDLRKARGEGWRGMNGGMMASLTAVEDLMRKIDELYQPTSQNTGIPSASGPSGKKRKAEDDIVVLD